MVINKLWSKITLQAQGSSLPSLQSAVGTVKNWGSRSTRELISNDGSDAITKYLRAVERLQQSANEGNAELITAAMPRLKAEFAAVLRREADYQAGLDSTRDWSSTVDSTANVFRYEDYTISDPPSDDAIACLGEIAERMNASGKIGECVSVYVSVRKPFLQGQLKKLKFEDLSMGWNRTMYDWDELKVKTEVWIQVSKICFKKLFAREKWICDRIFERIGDNSAKDECFVGTVNEFAVAIFRFVEAMSKIKPEYKRLETVASLYGAFLWVSPDANALFLSERGNRIRTTCAQTLSGIESEFGRMLHDFEDALVHENSQLQLDEGGGGGGGVDRSTEFAMEQIDVLVRNAILVRERGLLAELIKSAPSLDFGNKTIPQEDLGDASNRSFMERHLILIFVVLQKNLEVKSGTCQDFSLGQLFIMKNLHYIVKKVEDSPELQEMIGDSYSKLKDELSLAADTYKASICSKFLKCFEDEGLYRTRCFRLRLSKSAIRNKLISFNSVYEETRSRHCHSVWTIPDTQFRERICNSMSALVVPEYRNFLDRYVSNPEIADVWNANRRYTAEDLEALISRQLFAQSS